MTSTAGSRLYAWGDVWLRTHLLLPELRPVEAAWRPRPIVDVARAALPESLAGAGPKRRGLEVVGDTVMLTVDGLARYQVHAGRDILIDPAPGAPERSLRLFLLGSVLGILAHQRGLLPLHANAVVVNGEAVAFAGMSGAGKSTLAAQFHRAGHDVLCDDVCVIDIEQGQPVVWPGPPRIKLWGDALEAMGHDREPLDRAVEGRDKFQLPAPATGEPRPVPLKALYLLQRAADGETGGIVRISGAAALEAVFDNTYRSGFRDLMGLRAKQFGMAQTLLDRIKVFTASRVWGFEAMASEAARLARHAAADRPGAFS